ncbi:uncharacterized protein LOC109538776 isoform X1 [Dendroctonus ponderosae]|uniref:PDZ domain-containing protein n=2 Tax=Dendroctonus ponderosae TaxID=77166 RepID=A0AAR5PLF0_DENPD|nr:uncharacterized protein LOC109538776 isoform X1 [Dendroctonus ponderosae]XP_019761716.1 uncharacterized protein LOC109538776 isoform X1 [Dendroctonus ponderosae]XP_019761717.1 uncharacterized protein LOC109538776 isoform X1 [Dendroctonus ponderosae]XP_019761718.1 uncharacterized protein LOC109538776 isoform X1 [Dendroctonus ponderosae]
MSEIDRYVNEVICLQLSKPRNWKWEISTSKSSPHIALPTIQLFNSKGKLLVETLDNGTTERQSWKSGQASSFLQRSRSANLERKLTNCRSSAQPLLKDIQRCRSDTAAFRPKSPPVFQVKVQRQPEKPLDPQQGFGLKKSRSDVLDIKVKPKVQDKKPSRPYHRRSRSDDLLRKSLRNFDLEASRKRAEKDGYMNILSKERAQNLDPNKRLDARLATAETVACHKPSNLEITELAQPKKYVLRQSRAGILVLSAESLRKADRRRGPGDLQGNSSRVEQGPRNLFHSKSDVFPFERILHAPSSDKRSRRLLDENNNCTVKEPDSESRGGQCKSVNFSHLDSGHLIRPKQSPNRSCDLLQLVRRLSASKPDEEPASSRKILSEKSANRKESGHVSHVMGANVSRHSTKGLSGRRSQSSGSICNGKGRHQGDGSGGSLPSYLDDPDSASSHHCEDEEQPPLDENQRIPPLGDGAPLHWKFSDAQTSQCQDQGYGSERSPEEEFAPPLPDHDLDQCHHHLEAHSCYPFITPESTFTVKLNKGSRGLGLSVAGGIESGGSWPGLVRIKRLFPHQPASACGLLNVGDLLLEANGVPLTGLSNYEALEVLRTATNQVELKVCRPPPEVLHCVSPISEVPPPPPMRREPPNSLTLSSSYYGTNPEDDYYHGEFEVVLTKIRGTLGFTLRKEDDSALGHYVRDLLREPALTDGRLKAGDRIIAVNDVEIFPMSHEQAVQYLRICGDRVKLRLYRDSPQTPVTTLSPTEGSPRSSFSKKANLRQEAVDMLHDIAARKLLPCHQQVAARRSLSPTSSPRRLRRQHYPSDASQDSATRYIIPEEQFHEGMVKCKLFDEDSVNSLFTIDDEDLDRPARYEPNTLDLYNPNQTPVAARKPRFNFSLAHNAYELNNLDPEVLDAPNLAYNLGPEEGAGPEGDQTDGYPKEPASMPHIPSNKAAFSYKNPAYQSAHPPCMEASKGGQPTQKEETDTIKRKKGILKKDSSSSSKHADKPEIKTENVEKVAPMKDEFEILAIELNRGWNSRLGFSLQGAAGVTYVSAVYADSVAAKDGRIRPGDRIIKVNDEEVEHMNTNEIIDLLRIVRGPVCIFVKRIRSSEDCDKSNAEN